MERYQASVALLVRALVNDINRAVTRGARRATASAPRSWPLPRQDAASGGPNPTSTKFRDAEGYSRGALGADEFSHRAA